MYNVEDLKNDRHLDQTKIDEARQRMIVAICCRKLKKVRKAAGLTRSQLARRAGISRESIRLLENGNIDEIKIGTLHRYLEAIGCKLTISATMPGGTVIQIA